MRNSMKNLTGSQIETENGNKYTLGKQLGAGGQGVVYEDTSGEYAIKFYMPSYCDAIDNDIVERLRFIKDIKMPKNFVQILDIITSPYVGYVMKKVEKEYRPLNSYLVPSHKISFSEWYNSRNGFLERLFVGYVIAKAFGDLEKNNLAYCDISGNNILVKIAKNAAVKMIDIDNIYTGVGSCSVLGTPRFIAPEVVSGKSNPDILSDNYSLAVVLFELLRIGHPYISDNILDGSAEGEENALRGNADYVTSENSKYMLPEDIVFTKKLRDLFKRCFVDGKNNRINRPSAFEFERALLEASNKLIRCEACGAWHYPRKIGKSFAPCPWCDAPSKPKAILNFYDVLYAGENYKTAQIKGKIISKKLIETYIIKNGSKEKPRANKIKNLYVKKVDNIGLSPDATEDFLYVVSYHDKGCFARNEFSKEGILVKKYSSGNFFKLSKNKPILLENKDELYFEEEGKGVIVECGGQKYSFIRMARFVEVKDEDI